MITWSQTSSLQNWGHKFLLCKSKKIRSYSSEKGPPYLLGLVRELQQLNMTFRAMLISENHISVLNRDFFLGLLLLYISQHILLISPQSLSFHSYVRFPCSDTHLNCCCHVFTVFVASCMFSTSLCTPLPPHRGCQREPSKWLLSCLIFSNSCPLPGSSPKSIMCPISWWLLRCNFLHHFLTVFSKSRSDHPVKNTFLTSLLWPLTP